MSQEPVNAESTLEEQLVSYLDGELDSESCRRIEELLAVDPEVRGKLHWLEQTWEMLDELDTAPVGEDFTRTTLQMVAVAAEEDVRKHIEEAPRRRRRRWLLAGGGLLVAGLTGFMAVALMAPNPNQELLENLRVLENLDEYRQIKDIQFLRMLRKEKLFGKEEDNKSSQPATVRTGEDLVQHIKSLSLSQKYELLRKQNSFTHLEPAEQKRLRQLHELIQEDERPDELRGIVDRYYEWCKSLPPYSRADLTALSAEKRVEWIKKRLQEEQTKITSKPPPGKDADALWSWMEEYAKNHEKPFMAILPQWLQKNLSSMSSTARSRAVMGMMWQRPQGGSNKTFQITDGDVVDLRSRFTSQTQKLLEAGSPNEQIRIVQNWAHNLLRQKRSPGVGELVDDKLLAEFFEKDLKPEQRDHLMNLSGEDMQRELLQLYIIKNRPPDMFPHRPDDFTPGARGEGFGPDRRQPERSDKP